LVLTTNLEDSQFGMHTNLVANQFESGVDLPMKELRAIEVAGDAADRQLEGK